MQQTTDIAVIGGGIIGCSVAYHLAEALGNEVRITVLERGALAGGTSGCCMGHLMVTPDDPQAHAFTATSVRMWRELAGRLPDDFQLNPTGALYLADVAEDLPLLEQLQQQFADRGEDSEVLDNAALRQREPGLAEDIPGALYYPGDGVLLPMFAAAALLRGAQRENPRLDLRCHTAVTAIEVGGGRVLGLRTGRGRLAAGTVVVAAGVWSPEVARGIGLRELPIHPRRGDLAVTAHHTTPVRTQLLEVSYLRVAHGSTAVDPTRPGEDPGAHAVNLQPQTNGSCVIGSTRQFAGMQRVVDKKLLHRSLQRASRYAPGLLRQPVVRTWAGLRPYSIDQRPLIGPMPGVEGLYLATGHEGLGISLAPVTGKLLVQHLLGQEPVVPIEPYLPSRFSGESAPPPRPTGQP